MPTKDWGADTPISQPGAVEEGNERIVNVGAGFVFTVNGLRHNMTEAEREEWFAPLYAPPPKVD